MIETGICTISTYVCNQKYKKRNDHWDSVICIKYPLMLNFCVETNRFWLTFLFLKNDSVNFSLMC